MLHSPCHWKKFPGLLLAVLGKKLNVGDAKHSNKIKGISAFCLTCKVKEKAIRRLPICLAARYGPTTSVWGLK
jgi:hypothetical protein